MPLKVVNCGGELLQQLSTLWLIMDNCVYISPHMVFIQHAMFREMRWRRETCSWEGFFFFLKCLELNGFTILSHLSATYMLGCIDGICLLGKVQMARAGLETQTFEPKSLQVVCTDYSAKGRSTQGTRSIGGIVTGPSTATFSMFISLVSNVSDREKDKFSLSFWQFSHGQALLQAQQGLSDVASFRTLFELSKKLQQFAVLHKESYTGHWAAVLFLLSGHLGAACRWPKRCVFVNGRHLSLCTCAGDQALNPCVYKAAF